MKRYRAGEIRASGIIRNKTSPLSYTLELTTPSGVWGWRRHVDVDRRLMTSLQPSTRAVDAVPLESASDGVGYSITRVAPSDFLFSKKISSQRPATSTSLQSCLVITCLAVLLYLNMTAWVLYVQCYLWSNVTLVASERIGSLSWAVGDTKCRRSRPQEPWPMLVRQHEIKLSQYLLLCWVSSLSNMQSDPDMKPRWDVMIQCIRKLSWSFWIAHVLNYISQCIFKTAPFRWCNQCACLPICEDWKVTRRSGKISRSVVEKDVGALSCQQPVWWVFQCFIQLTTLGVTCSLSLVSPVLCNCGQVSAHAASFKLRGAQREFNHCSFVLTKFRCMSVLCVSLSPTSLHYQKRSRKEQCPIPKNMPWYSISHIL